MILSLTVREFLETANREEAITELIHSFNSQLGMQLLDNPSILEGFSYREFKNDMNAPKDAGDIQVAEVLEQIKKVNAQEESFLRGPGDCIIKEFAKLISDISQLIEADVYPDKINNHIYSLYKELQDDSDTAIRALVVSALEDLEAGKNEMDSYAILYKTIFELFNVEYLFIKEKR